MPTNDLQLFALTHKYMYIQKTIQLKRVRAFPLTMHSACVQFPYGQSGQWVFPCALLLNLFAARRASVVIEPHRKTSISAITCGFSVITVITNPARSDEKPLADWPQQLYKQRIQVLVKVRELRGGASCRKMSPKKHWIETWTGMLAVFNLAKRYPYYGARGSAAGGPSGWARAHTHTHTHTHTDRHTCTRAYTCTHSPTHI